MSGAMPEDSVAPLALVERLRGVHLEMVDAVLGGEGLERVAELAAAGALAGTRGLTPAVAERLSEAVEAIPTEASAMALRCYQGATGTAEIRGGRRTVELSPAGGLTFYYDVPIALRSTLRLTEAVREAADLEEANEILRARGVRTELDYEREHV